MALLSRPRSSQKVWTKLKKGFRSSREITKLKKEDGEIEEGSIAVKEEHQQSSAHSSKDPILEESPYEILHNSKSSIETIIPNIPSIKKDAKPKQLLRDLVTHMFLHFTTLRQANHSILIEEDRVKMETERAKAPMNFTTLQLHNLVYEKSHYLKAIKACKDFKSKYPDIELVPEEEFLRDAPKDIKDSDFSKDSVHNLMLKGLNFELYQRKELCKHHAKLEQQKKILLITIANRKKFLTSLPSHLKSLKKASLPVQNKLRIMHTKKLKQHHSAELLPPALYVIYSQLLAHKEAFVEPMDLEIIGSLKDAQAFARKQAHKETDISSVIVSSKLEDDIPDDEEEEPHHELQLLHTEHEEEEHLAGINYKLALGDISEGELALLSKTSAIVSSNISNFTNESLHKPPSSIQNPNFPNSLQHPSFILSTPCVTSSSPNPIYFEETQQDLDNRIVQIDDEIPSPKTPDVISKIDRMCTPEMFTKVCRFTIFTPPLTGIPTRLDAYIYNYLVKNQLYETAGIFHDEASVVPNIARFAPDSFLLEWWSVFWELFMAKRGLLQLESAVSYLKAQGMRKQEKKRMFEDYGAETQVINAQQQQYGADEVVGVNHVVERTKSHIPKEVVGDFFNSNYIVLKASEKLQPADSTAAKGPYKVPCLLNEESIRQTDIAKLHAAAVTATLNAEITYAIWAPLTDLAKSGIINGCGFLLSAPDFPLHASDFFKLVSLRQRSDDASASEIGQVMWDIFQLLMKTLFNVETYRAAMMEFDYLCFCHKLETYKTLVVGRKYKFSRVLLVYNLEDKVGFQGVSNDKKWN